MLYKDWLNDWLQNYVKPTNKDKTYYHYGQNVNLHIIPKLGEYELNELSSLIIQKFITELLQSGNLKTGEGLAASTVNSIITTVQLSLEVAHRLLLVENYEPGTLKRPRMSTTKVTCFNPTEQKKLEQAALSDKRDKMKGVVICLYTGMRIGELLALEWTDVNFLTKELTVSKTCHDSTDNNGKYRRITDTPKTETSNRVIPLPKPIINVLKEMKKESKSEYMISQNGKPISVRSYQRSFELLLKKEKIPHRGFHSLRHTFATRALECGMDVKTLSEILGHRSPTITLNRYVHSLNEHKREMMNKVGKLL